MKRKDLVFYLYIIGILLISNLYVQLSPQPSPFYGENYYKAYSDIAEHYFDKWGWETSDNVTYALTHDYYFFEVGHGGSYSFEYNGAWISTWDIKDNIPPIPANFIFLVSCDALTHTGNYTWATTLNYRVLIGLKNTTSTSWRYFMGWEKCFFRELDRGHNVSYAFTYSCHRYPTLKGHIAYIGDGSLTVKDMIIPPYDLNRDRRVNVLDLIEVARHWTG